jgi:hypothetical protein
MALISYVGKNLLTINAKGVDPQMFMPGINEVSEKALECMQLHPAFNALVEQGKLVILQENKPDPDGKRSVKDMLSYIPKIFDSKLLKKIIDSDGRDQVISAAKDQLASFKKKKESSEDENHFS